MTIATPIPDAAFAVNQERIRGYSYNKKVGNYLLGRQLGQGSFAKVKEALHVPTGERVAMKIIDQEKCRTDAYVRRNLRKEAKILQQLRNENIVQLYEILETQNSYYLAMEYCSGELMHHILKSKSLTEHETRKYLRQIIRAVFYMHQVGVIHRDLKIENLLLGEKDDIKIIDFGLSTLVRTTRKADGQLVSQLCRTQCGSPAYAAPEVLAKKSYSISADVWSIGVNMFAMLVGSLPYTVHPFSIKGLCQKMMSGEINPLPGHVSRGARELLNRFLNPNPDTRITLKEAMLHPWLNEASLCLTPSPYPNRLKVADLIPEVTRHMTKELDFRMGDTVRLLLINSPHQATAVYHLLVRKLRRYCRQRKLPWPPRRKGDDDALEELEVSLEDDEEVAEAEDEEEGAKVGNEEEKKPFLGSRPRILSRRRPQDRRRLSSSDKENDDATDEKKRVTFRDIPPITTAIRATSRRLAQRRQVTAVSPPSGAVSLLPELNGSAYKPPTSARHPSPIKPHLIDARALTVVLPSKRAQPPTVVEVEPPAPPSRSPIRKSADSGMRRNRLSAPATQVVRYALDTRSGAKHVISDNNSPFGLNICKV